MAPETGPPALRLVGLRHRYSPGAPEVLRVDDLAVARGEQLAIAGPSGSGKTTFLHVAAGILEPSEGRVEVAGTDLTALRGAARDRWRGRRIGIVFQTFNLLQGLTARENLLVAAMFGDLPRRERAARTDALLDRVGLREHAGKRPSQLSVGQQQRVSIARALVNRPDLLLADEPAASLDQANAENVVSLLCDVAREGGHALVVVAHDPVVLGRFGKVLDVRRLLAA